MTIFGLIASFGGGLFAASIGALPAFIMTGVFAIAGAIAGMVSPGSDAQNILVNIMAFGPFFGPYVSFAGGVAAAAYAKKKGLNPNGADIATATFKYQKPDVLLIGGIFGVGGYLVKTLVYDTVLAGGISPQLVTDSGIVVFFSGVLVRLIFGGKMKTSDKVLSSGDTLNTTLTVGVVYSLLVAACYFVGVEAGWDAGFGGLYHVLVFGMAAVGLVFAEFGQAFVGCHHIVIIAAEATVQSYAKMQNMWLSIIIGVIFGTVSAILGDIEGNMINCGTDSHIDNPAFAIFVMTFVINALFPNA